MSEKVNKLLVAAVVILLIIVGVKNNKLDQFETTIEEQESTISILQDELGTYEDENSDLSAEVWNLTEELENISIELDVASKAFDFYYYNAVLVTTTGECYHTYDCYYVEGHSYYIYNIENAESKGYRACSYCFG